MNTKTHALAAILLLSFSFLHSSANAGGVDRHIFDSHAISLVKTINNENPTSVSNCSLQVCINTVFKDIDQFSSRFMDTIVLFYSPDNLSLRDTEHQSHISPIQAHQPGPKTV